MDTRITSCIHINFRFFPLKTGQEYLACTWTAGFSYLVLLFPPLFPIACALQHIFTSYKDCQTWLCCSHMNVRLNLSPMGKMLEVEMNIRITLCVLMNFRSFSDCSRVLSMHQAIRLLSYCILYRSSSLYCPWHLDLSTSLLHTRIAIPGYVAHI